MGILDLFRAPAPQGSGRAEPMVHAMSGSSAALGSLNDPELLEFMRGGESSGLDAGISVSPKTALQNTTVLRCVSLISRSIGMLPLHLRDRETKEKATDHSLFRLLHRKPNGWQTAYQFRTMMQQQALTHGNAIALIVRSGPRIIQLVPITWNRVTVRQLADWSLEYTIDGKKYKSRDVFHLREGLTEDGFTGLSRVKAAHLAIALAIQTERSAGRSFSQGTVVGGFLKIKNSLSPEAYQRLQDNLDSWSGVENSHRWKILEEGAEATPGVAPGKDAQAIENRHMQVEEIARAFDVPRPLLMIDDTSWGTGIDILGQMFVSYGLNPWFEAWEQAIEFSLMSDAEADKYEAKFNPGGLLRGSMSGQADFWAKALGAGGQQPFASPDEARAAFDWPKMDNSELAPQMGAQTGGADVTTKTA